VPDGDDGAVVRLSGRTSAAADGLYAFRYATRTGALLRVDDAVVGAFDSEHDAMHVPLPAGDHSLALEVEKRSMPSSGLPSGPGLRWHLLLARASERPREQIEIERIASAGSPRAELRRSEGADRLAVVGHAHLDVAWLWTYEETRRKAVRTFATAVNLLEEHDGFVFTQSQPQLYDWVREDEPELFAHVQQLARAGRFDPSGAAMWVEPDCNVPSGESLLRQLVAGIRYAERELGTTPTVAWLPDSFGFPRTLPTLLQHAGIPYFATTKLCWNDTTQFPYPRFIWEGADGSRVLGALFASYEGKVTQERMRLARERDEPLVVGYSDGGGGPTGAIVDEGTRHGRWTTLHDWFERSRAHASAGPAADRETTVLPSVRDELYLEYHRGVFTTHHDIKARNAALERRLGRAELALAWMVALHASPFFVDEARRSLAEAWEIVLRNQFHDVLPGTSIAPVYADAHAEYDRADAIVQRVIEAGSAALPRFASAPTVALAAPVRDGSSFVFENDALRARLADDGRLIELAPAAGGANVVREANVLCAYHDKPEKWEAWNIDAGYERRPIPVEPLGCEEVDDALYVRYRIDGSYGAARISLALGERFLRVEHAIEWRERKTLLRCENRLVDLENPRAFFGAPHGVVERPAIPATAAERAKFEAPGQRFGRVESAGRGGLAILTRDTYGWSVGADEGGGIRLGHSLLRGTTWPDPDADLGQHHIAYAFLPHAGSISSGELEAAWRRFVRDEPQPEMFSCDDSAIAIEATKPADDGNGVVVRMRECDGVARDAAVGCAVRVNAVQCVDALERPLPTQDATLVEGRIVAPFAPFALRSFRVLLG